MYFFLLEMFLFKSLVYIYMHFLKLIFIVLFSITI